MDYNELDEPGGTRTSNDAAKKEILTFVKRKQSIKHENLMSNINNKLRRNL